MFIYSYPITFAAVVLGSPYTVALTGLFITCRGCNYFAGVDLLTLAAIYKGRGCIARGVVVDQTHYRQGVYSSRRDFDFLGGHPPLLRVLDGVCAEGGGGAGYSYHLTTNISLP